MSIKRSTAAISMLPLFFASNAFAATPFQFEAMGGFAQATTEGNIVGGKLDRDIIQGELTYYLRQVDYSTGPLVERAFLDKAAYVAGSFSQVKPDRGENTDTFGVETHFVTDSDFIFELGYETSDNGSATDRKTTTLGFGKYLDGKSAAILSVARVDGFSDATTINGEYKKLVINESAGTGWTAELDISYIDSKADTGYGFDVLGAYYLSDTTAVGVNAGYEKFDEADDADITFGLIGSYFLVENIFVNAIYDRLKNDDFTRDIYGLSVGARF